VQGTVDRLREHLADVVDLGAVAMLLGWDQRTMMPRGGAPARADQLGTIVRIAHERFVSDEIGSLLDDLSGYAETLDRDSNEASLIRMVRRDYEKARRVPSELRAEMSRAAALAQPVWEEARRKSDFALFLPALERALELKLQYVACFDPADEDYDHLLDDYEPGMTTAEVRAVFDELKTGLVSLIAAVAERADAIEDGFLRGSFPIDRQQGVERAILDAFGFTPDEWRLDETVHPFASRGGPKDIRLTTRHREDNLGSLFACMHEFGHGLYEHNVDPALYRTPLARGASLGVHESQSRMWENLVGRSRPFWRRFFPLVQEAFPDQLGGVDAEGFYRAVSRVEPSLIRIEADEATYNLHIVIRFELEQDLLSGRLRPVDLPEAWDAKMAEYLGVAVPDVADGCLQDTHWANGAFGYFPTYALGNILAAQLWERLRADLPDLDEEIEAGRFGPLRDWLREHVHRHGRKHMPHELVERVVGRPLDPQPLLRYLRVKLGEMYGLDGA
jgi:carboxypeptidase Taq